MTTAAFCETNQWKPCLVCPREHHVRKALVFTVVLIIDQPLPRICSTVINEGVAN